MMRPVFRRFSYMSPLKREGSFSSLNVLSLASTLQPRYLHLASVPRGSLADPKTPISKGKGNEETNGKGKKKLVLSGIVGSLLAGGLWAYYDNRKRRALQGIGNLDENKDFILASPPPAYPASRSIVNPEDKTGLSITLFQYQTCPFCCKARVFLDYFGFTYDVIEVNSVLRTQTKWSKYKKVPILVAKYGDKVLQVNDSSVIVSALYSFLLDPEKKLEDVMDCYPTLRSYDDDGREVSEIPNKYFLMMHELQMVERTKKNLVDERRWRRWVDDTLVHTLSPNVYRTFSESLETFEWFSVAGNWEQHFSWWERQLVIYVGALAMLFVGKRLKRRHRIKDDVRQSLYEECNTWCAAVASKGTPFFGGSSPNLADLAVFGVLNAIEGCQAFQDARLNTNIGVWFDRMKASVKERGGKELVGITRH